jgi:hypothetical protein
MDGTTIVLTDFVQYQAVANSSRRKEVQQKWLAYFEGCVAIWYHAKQSGKRGGCSLVNPGLA